MAIKEFDWNVRGASLSALKKPTNSKCRKEVFYTFDTETKDGLKGKQLFCWSLSYYKKERNSSGRFESKLTTLNGGEQLDLLFEKLSEWKDKTHYRTIYVHNLGFDCRFLVKYCAQHKHDYKPILSGSNMVSLAINDLKVRFVDSFQFLRTSQEQSEIEWEVDSGISKAETKALMKELFENKKYKDKIKPFRLWSNKEKEKLKYHCRNDTMALHIIMERFRETIWDIASVDTLSVITLASLSMKAFRIALNEGDIKQIENPFVYFTKGENGSLHYHLDSVREAFVRKSYYGGRNEVFNLNKLKDGKYIDRVSMYPSEMYFNYFPLGYPKWEQDINKINALISQYMIIDRIPDPILRNYEMEKPNVKLGFINAIIRKTDKVKTKYPILPVRLNKRTLFVNSDIEGVYTIMELAKARGMGYEVIPKPIGIIGAVDKHSGKDYDSNIQKIALIYPKKGKVFTSFVAKFMKVKNTSKGGRREGAKRILNSCYGKFGQAFKRKTPKTKFFHSEEVMFDEIGEEMEKYHIRKNSETGIWIAMKAEETTVIRTYMNVGIASCTTAYSRLNLWEKLYEMERKRIEVWYCDTDSITIENTNLSSLKLGHSLGDWDIEQSFDEVKFLAPKCYISIMNGKPHLKMKGVERRKIVEICEIASTLEEIEELVREPIELAERYMTYTESLRYGQFLATKQLCKHYSFENAKRQFLVDGTSVAWENKSIPCWA